MKKQEVGSDICHSPNNAVRIGEISNAPAVLIVTITEAEVTSDQVGQAIQPVVAKVAEYFLQSMANRRSYEIVI